MDPAEPDMHVSENRVGPVGTDHRRDRSSTVGVLIAGGFILLLIFACDAFMELAALRLPGALIALFLLFWRFKRQGRLDPTVALLFDATIPILPLFFVPAAVGIIEQFGTIATAWFAIVMAVVIGTIAVLAVVGQVAQIVLDRRQAPTLTNEVQAE